MGRIIIVTLLCSEIMGRYNTPDTMVEIGAYVVGHEISFSIGADFWGAVGASALRETGPVDAEHPKN